jgi:hypothetical protein
MKFAVKSFTGVAPKANARYLAEGGAQKALNVEAFGQTLKPLRGYSDAVTTVPDGTQSVYRYGQSETEEAKYWLAWPGDVDVCRSQIANDTNEWTFITDGAYPKATNSATLQDDLLPAVHEWVRLGLPTATPAATAAVTERGPCISVGKETWGLFSTAIGLTIATTGGVVSSTAVTLTDVSNAAAIATAINTAFSGTGYVLAIASGDLLRLFGSVALKSSTLSLGWTTATNIILYASFRYNFFANSYYLLKVSGATWGTWTTSTVLTFTGAAFTLGNVTVSLPSVASANTIRDRIITVFEAAGYDCGTAAGDEFNVYTSGSDIYVKTAESLFPKMFEVRWPGSSPASITATWKEEIPESRAYTWTWVSTIDNLSMESGAAPPSKVVDLPPLTSYVTLTGLPASVDSTQNILVTHKRIYRTAGSDYLFVAEIDGQATTFTDALLAEDLGELLPEAATSAMPPDGLLGLTSLPNGLLAGFLNQDIYFSLMYRPYAWPVAYMQAVDFPIVGLGAIDTTLVVLTTGNPYFIQGSSPGSMVVVKADLDQACVSKRSIVSMGGGVLYASPDGLVLLSTAGSRVVTADRFSREDWQKLNPTTIHAYGHDLRYVAFHNADPDGATGFVYDIASGEFIKHTLTATAGYQDLRNDALYVATPGDAVVKWGQGNRLTGVWRSKKATMPHTTSFASAQVEAEAYGVCVISGAIDPDYTTSAACAAAGYCTIGGEVDLTKTTSAACTGASGTWTSYNGTWTYPSLEVYMDGTLVHTQTVTSRHPFRLPATPGRDVELELDTCSEVFSIALAHSHAELFDD